MKFLFASATDFEHRRKLTGAHKRYIELVKSFSTRNEVYLVAYPYSIFNGYNISYYPIEKKIGSKLPNHICETLSLTHALKKYRSALSYDYAICFGTTGAISLANAGYKNIVVLFREDLINYHKAIDASFLKIRYDHYLEKKAVKAAKMIFVQCENDKKELIKRHKGIENKIQIQINNINTEWIKADNKTIMNAIPQILFIGSFDTVRKGHHILLPAIARLLDEGMTLDLYVLGDGKTFVEYKNKYEKYPGIHFEGYTKNVKKYLEKCDILLVPSLIDSCPNTVLEGLNAGLAVYGCNTGGIPDLLQYEKYMFEPTSEGIYEFLLHIVDHSLYQKDRLEQRVLIDKLTFDWGKAIEDKILLMNKGD